MQVTATFRARPCAGGTSGRQGRERKPWKRSILLVRPSAYRHVRRHGDRPVERSMRDVTAGPGRGAHDVPGGLVRAVASAASPLVGGSPVRRARACGQGSASLVVPSLSESTSLARYRMLLLRARCCRGPRGSSAGKLSSAAALWAGGSTELRLRMRQQLRMELARGSESLIGLRSGARSARLA